MSDGAQKAPLLPVKKKTSKLTYMVVHIHGLAFVPQHPMKSLSSICPSVLLSVHLCVCPSIRLSIRLSVRPSVTKFSKDLIISFF